jgi:hypothetical protein
MTVSFFFVSATIYIMQFVDLSMKAGTKGGSKTCPAQAVPSLN